MHNVISRQAAIDALEKEEPTPFVNKDGSIDLFGAGRQYQWYKDGIAIMNLSPAQPETIRPAWKADDRYVKTMFQPFPYCPKCNHYLITGDNYCSVCGRRIDWSKEDE